MRNWLRSWVRLGQRDKSFGKCSERVLARRDENRMCSGTTRLKLSGWILDPLYGGIIQDTKP